MCACRQKQLPNFEITVEYHPVQVLFVSFAAISEGMSLKEASSDQLCISIGIMHESNHKNEGSFHEYPGLSIFLNRI